MLSYLLQRLITLGLTLLLTSALVFALTELLPGDPTSRLLGRDAGPAARTALRVELGLDQPPLVRYGQWLMGFVQGDWGRSYSSGRVEVRPLVTQRLENSLRLAGYTLLLAVPLALGLGVVAALNENTWLDNMISVVSLAVVGLPEFVTALVLINLVALNVSWLPANLGNIPRDANLGVWARSLLLPAITATLVVLGYIARMARAGVLDELRKPYVRIATLKGLPRRTVIVKHVLRNALLPTITVIALSVGWLIGGLIVIENVFGYPGLGQEMVLAVESQDFPRIQASVMVIVFFFAAANLLADVLYALLNPRIRPQ